MFMHGLTTFVGFTAGAALIAIVLQDVFEVMLLPRRVLRRWRLMGVYFQAAWRIWAWAGGETASINASNS